MPEETAKNETGGYVEITPKDLVYNKDTNKIKFTVDYHAKDKNGNDAKNLLYLTLVMFYDSSKLKWHGLASDSILGTHDDESKSPPPGAIKKWRYKYVDEYGEFWSVEDYQEGTGVFDDDENTNRMIYLKWGFNFKSEKSSFEYSWGGYKNGFIGDSRPLPARLFATSFTPVNGFRGTTSVNFKVQRISKDADGSDYGSKTTSVTITNN